MCDYNIIYTYIVYTRPERLLQLLKLEFMKLESNLTSIRQVFIFQIKKLRNHHILTIL